MESSTSKSILESIELNQKLLEKNHLKEEEQKDESGIF